LTLQFFQLKQVATQSIQCDISKHKHMKTLYFKLIIILFLTVIHWKANAQCAEWRWPQDRKTAEEKVALLQDAIRDKKYRQAIKSFNWLVVNTPELNSSIYIHGATIYDALASKEKDQSKKKIYVDSLLMVYDLRMSQCDDKENVLWRKATAAFKFMINGNDANLVLPIMDSVFINYPTSASDGLLLPYMQTIVINRQKFKTPDDEGILLRYELLTKLTESRIKSNTNSKQKPKLVKTRKDIDEWLFKVIKPDCEFVKSNLAPRFHQNPTDLMLAKRVFSYMLQGKCTEDPLWLQAGEAIFKQEKDFGLGKNIGLRYLTLEKIPEAEDYFNTSLALAPNRKDSADISYYKGLIKSKQSDNQQARHYFVACISMDSSRRDACERIGDLYVSSFEQCAKKERQADDRAIYLAAYDWYAKAGNAKKMAMAKQLFPSREEIFVVNYEKGDRIKVGCWINEEVSIITRD